MRSHGLLFLVLLSLAIAVALAAMWFWPDPAAGGARPLLVYCAAGLRQPMEHIAAEYRKECKGAVEYQFGGSNTLLSQLEVSRLGDLFLAADDSYIRLAMEKGLIRETLPIASQRPVIAVRRDNPKNIRSLADLTRDDVRVGLGNPDQAAVGRIVRKVLTASGQWAALEANVASHGVFKPTVNETANDIKLGSVDAGIIWDTTVEMYPDLMAIHAPQFDQAAANVTIAIAASAKDPAAALRFARYVTARDRGLLIFKKAGFAVVDGDVWAERPELTFYIGSVNRRPLEPIIQAFEKREGVKVNTVYNGCGMLTAQMRVIHQQKQNRGFPDSYMACDVYYLENVKDWFQEAVEVSDTDIVIVTKKGNPKAIKSLADLARPEMRISIGQPEQCTIGALTRRLLQAENLYEKVMPNVATQTATSAMLLPTVTTGSVDATLAYASDCVGEQENVTIVPINSPMSKAVQPFGIARSSDHKHLVRRLYAALSSGRDLFEAAGFRWRTPATQPREARP